MAVKERASPSMPKVAAPRKTGAAARDHTGEEGQKIRAARPSQAN